MAKQQQQKMQFTEQDKMELKIAELKMVLRQTLEYLQKENAAIRCQYFIKEALGIE